MRNKSLTRAIVDLNAYAANLRLVRDLIGNRPRITAVVKANAYGHGLIPVARRALAEGVAMLGVAEVAEAIELREAGIKAPILVFLQPTLDFLPEVIEYDLRPMISDKGFAEALNKLAQQAKKIVPVHCKVDSGMGRQGFFMSQALRDLPCIARMAGLAIEGVATHFPVADLENDSFTAEQLDAFTRFVRKLDALGVPYEMVHAANSPAIINYKGSFFSMVRPGLMTYGIWPCAQPEIEPVLSPVLRWETRVVLIKEFERGSSIGYGRTYVTSERMRVAILPVGYADGYRRAFTNNADVLIRGKRCSVRGSVCMDQIVVDVTAVEDIAVNDVATLLGSDGPETITATELAQRAQTIPYEILTGIGPRVYREYHE